MIDTGLRAFGALSEERMQNIQGIAVYQHGRRIASRHWVDDQPTNLYSLSKSFASTAVGMAIEEGLLRLDERVVDVLPDCVPDRPDANLERLTLRDLLIMASGHDRSYLLVGERRELYRAGVKDWVRFFLAQPFPYAPGTRFVYDTGCTYIASAMLQRRAGETLLSYCSERLFAPLGIETPRWDACPLGVTMGGSSLYLTLEDVAKLGLLYLQRGVWNAKRLVPESWVEEATRKHIETFDGAPEHDGHYGYGYQFWMCKPEGIYRGDGSYGQFCVIAPRLDATIAILSRQYGPIMGILQTVWDTVLPMLEENA